MVWVYGQQRLCRGGRWDTVAVLCCAMRMLSCAMRMLSGMTGLCAARALANMSVCHAVGAGSEVLRGQLMFAPLQRCAVMQHCQACASRSLLLPV